VGYHDVEAPCFQVEYGVAVLGFGAVSLEDSRPAGLVRDLDGHALLCWGTVTSTRGKSGRRLRRLFDVYIKYSDYPKSSSPSRLRLQ
jgi:hypothetical protein